MPDQPFAPRLLFVRSLPRSYRTRSTAAVLFPYSDPRVLASPTPPLQSTPRPRPRFISTAAVPFDRGPVSAPHAPCSHSSASLSGSCSNPHPSRASAAIAFVSVTVRRPPLMPHAAVPSRSLCSRRRSTPMQPLHSSPPLARPVRPCAAFPLPRNPREPILLRPVCPSQHRLGEIPTHCCRCFPLDADPSTAFRFHRGCSTSQRSFQFVAYRVRFRFEGFLIARSAATTFGTALFAHAYFL